MLFSHPLTLVSTLLLLSTDINAAKNVEYGRAAAACSKLYTVKSGDSCYSIGAANGLSAAQVMSYNSAMGINSKCTNLQIGSTLCLSKPETVTASSLSSVKTSSTSSVKTSSTSSVKTSSTSIVTSSTSSGGLAFTSIVKISSTSVQATSTKTTSVQTSSASAPVTSSSSTLIASPSSTVAKPETVSSLPAASTTYKVIKGQTCNSISALTSVSVADILKLNPTINKGCTNLEIGQVLILSAAAPVSSAVFPSTQVSSSIISSSTSIGSTASSSSVKVASSSSQSSSVAASSAASVCTIKTTSNVTDSPTSATGVSSSIIPSSSFTTPTQSSSK